jgi:glycosyltransferase involved in cell wall biosynthesis
MFSVFYIKVIGTMKLSVLVVTYNDDKYLEECLRPLRHFDELIVVDLGSTDHSIEIAKVMGVIVHEHSWAPVIELILPDLTELTRNDWILRVDPDEVFSPALVDELLALEVSDDYGMITFPLQYYFMNRKLDTTAWGGIRYAARVSHKERTFMESGVHGRHLCKEGYGIYQIDFSRNNVAAHYWVDNLSQMFSKHERYLKMEGESRYGKGARFSWVQLIKQTLVHFRFSFIQRSGWRGGWAGWFLSFFYAQYEARGWLALRQYEKHLGVDRVG